VVEVVDVFGRPGIVYQRVNGRTLLEALISPGADVTGIARQLVELQLWLHTVTPPSGLPRLRDRLSSRIVEARGVDAETRARALAELAELEDGVALCHGDLHPGNIMETDAGLVVVDWFDVSVGSEAADVARTAILIQPRLRTGPPPHLVGSTNALLASFHAAFRSEHRELAPFVSAELARWELVVAVARLCEPGHQDDLAALLAGG
jgi:streptomycin 6-kinase